MIKLKDLLLESAAPDIFVPRRVEDRVERLVKQYIRNGSKGNLNLYEMDLVELPAILNNVTVDGHFYCNNNKLKSLSGAPQRVRGGFYCYSNLLTSLSGAPQHVGGGFYCYRNRLTTLSGAPQHVDGNFYCGNNLLTSLSGSPQHVGGTFICRNNAVKFTESQVRAVCDVDGRIFV